MLTYADIGGAVSVEAADGTATRATEEARLASKQLTANEAANGSATRATQEARLASKQLTALQGSERRSILEKIAKNINKQVHIYESY